MTVFFARTRENDAEENTRKVVKMVVVGFGWGALKRREREKGKKFGNRTKGKELSPNEVNTRHKKRFGLKKEPQERKERQERVE